MERCGLDEDKTGLELLMARYDKNRDGRVTFSEVRNGLQIASSFCKSSTPAAEEETICM